MGLEIVWDQKNNALEAFKYFSSKGQKTSAIRKSVADLEKQVQNLERELQDIPSYIAQNENNRTEAAVAKTDAKKIDSVEALKTFGNKVMFRLDLSGWSTEKLVGFSNVFDTTEGARHFGVRILPQSYVMKTFKGLYNISKATGGAISWSSYHVVFDKYVPKTWPQDSMKRRPEILRLEEGLLRGEPVFVPLLYNGDEVSLRMPKGIYFLNYTVQLKFPTRNQPFTKYGYCRRVEQCVVGPYFVEVDAKGHNVITYSPKPHPITLDELNRYFARLEQLGVDSLILKSLSKTASYQAPEKSGEAKEETSSETQTEKIYVRCLSCGTLNSEKANFCQNCGGKFVPNASETKK